MKIHVNQKETVTEAANLYALAQELNLPEAGVAVAVDNKMIPRTSWSETRLHEDAKITIIKAACGG